jgi:transaldolase
VGARSRITRRRELVGLWSYAQPDKIIDGKNKEMPKGYFQRVTEETGTRFWVNNPSSSDLENSIKAGAINCTTNPAFPSKLMKSEPDYLRAVIDQVIRECQDDDEAADEVYQHLSAQVLKKFFPLYEKSSGEYGYVTMQGDPRIDEDPQAIIKAFLRYRGLGKNFMTKIPVIKSGLKAIEAAVEANIPICATEVFSLDQAVCICELYEAAVKKTGNHPPFYVTHISGIFDEYLEKTVQREGLEIDPSFIKQAGCAIARKEYWLLKGRGYHATLLGGGARGTHHFTEMVGGDLHVTINWSTAEELIGADHPVKSRIDVDTSQNVIDELSEKLFDFRRAYYENSLTSDEFASYGPVQLFRNAFLNGYYLLLAEIAARRHALAI